MCGIAGFLGGSRFFEDAESVSGPLEAMASAMLHRGPDDSGIWFDLDRRIGLAHRRLSVMDLSDAGRQPMMSPSGRYVISFNGEIYNHQHLRADLERRGGQPVWRGHSDTETLAACFDAYGGIRGVLSMLNGMFAIAVWDRQNEELTLVRDRSGEKPLFYGWQGEGLNKSFLFASELKALKRHPSFIGRVSRRAIASYLQLSYVPAPLSVYERVAKLMPGHILTVSLRSNHFLIEPYWDARQVAFSGLKANSSRMDKECALSELHDLLSSSIEDKMMGDVPVGAFLSGGVDSSLVVAIMQGLSKKPVQTYTVGFDETGFDEAVAAKDVARYLGTDHSEIYVSPSEALKVIPAIPSIYDEPYGDASSIPVLLVSQLARRGVTVALSGDGGDELFGGYNRYQLADGFWNQVQHLPSHLRQSIGFCVKKTPSDVFGFFLNSILRRSSFGAPSDLVRLQGKLATSFSANSVREFHSGLVSHWRLTDAVVREVSFVDPWESREDAVWNSDLTAVQKMMLFDFLTYLPDDILVKVDMASMSKSLEVRVPFLDPRIIDFSWKLPHRFKIRKRENKWILRQLLYRHVPRALVDRPKMGFSVPVDQWLRGPLKTWASDLLDEQRMVREGYLDAPLVTKRWRAHLDGHGDFGSQIWNVLMFQLWLSHEKASV